LPTTSWTLLFHAAAETGSSGLEQFCTLYWPPVYAFIRARVRDTEEAKDLTQAFFARLIEHHDLRGVDPQRGRFRSSCRF
jgi:RNA polymerase sigma-70 factor (ECF subfamily)